MSTPTFDHLAPEGFALKPFQTIGVAYASVQRRTFIADEMGLGKTIQALVALEANNAFPAVVVCPSGLRGNWASEIQIWLPHRSVQVLYGRKAEADIDAEIVVVGYDVLADWVAAIAQPFALVLDESHYVKTDGAKRSKAVEQLIASVPTEGLVLFLTGTAFQNRPGELINQLRLLGRLEQVSPTPKRATGANGGYSDKDWEFAFKFRFCGPERNGSYWEFKGASNLDELNARLRASCFIRRERQDVTGLANTVRVPVKLSLNGALKTYRKAEADIIKFVELLAANAAAIQALKVGNDPDAAAKIAGYNARQTALRAEVLVTLGTLRRLAGEAKVPTAIEWVQNFLTSNPEKSIVIFAWHKAVQAQLIAGLAEYDPAQILGGQADVEAQKARFQAKGTRVIVASIKAAAEGHTLTAASDVLFVEQPWHPGAEQQCEDRTNRIGQTNHVFAFKLIADGTIDNWVAELIEQKREWVTAGLVGGDVETTGEGSITSAIIERFQKGGE